MSDPNAESHDSLLDDSWFDRPRKAKRRAITRAEVFAALRKGTVESEAPVHYEGLDDSWFDR